MATLMSLNLLPMKNKIIGVILNNVSHKTADFNNCLQISSQTPEHNGDGMVTGRTDVIKILIFISGYNTHIISKKFHTDTR